MEISEHIASLRNDGALMAKAIAAVDPSAAIPTCPEWTMRELALHQGEVHRWARTIVAGGLTEPPDGDFVGDRPDDAGLVDWFRDGYESLASTLESADPDLEYWAFMKASSPLAFWARRQCHETAIHRADAESASGPITPIDANVAADGIDELLVSFITRRGGRLHSDTPRSLGIHTTDVDCDWVVHISHTVTTETNAGDADCTVSGTASDLQLFVWNRRGVDGLRVDGDASLLDLWRDSVTIRWGR